MDRVFEKHLFVCTQQKPMGAPNCAEAGGVELLEAFRAEVGKAGLADQVGVTGCGCLGLCERGPNIIIYPEGKIYTSVRPDEVALIVSSHLAGDKQLTGRDDPEPAVLLAEIAAHREKVRAIMASREKAGVMPDWLSSMIRAFQPSRVVLTGVELDAFTAVDTGATAEQAATKMNTDPRATEMLLNALVALGLLEKRGDTFVNTEISNTYLVQGARHDSRLALGHSSSMWKNWSTMTDCVREGTAVGYQEMVDRGDSWTKPFIEAMHKNTIARAPVVAGAIDLGDVKQLLDLGGGSGGYAIAFARTKPDLQATVFDLPTVTPLTRQYADETEVGSRIKTTNGDLRTDEYGSGYDMVFISAICHMNGPQENIDMFKKAFKALRPGGRLVMQDFILEDDKTSPTHAALFALNMLVGTRHGSSYSEAEYSDWLQQARFGEVRRQKLPGPTDLMVAKRPE